jgi:DNA (cytosine-5)-methyltransferase 1
MTALRVLDLFSGIGGISLGLESVRDCFYQPEYQTVAFCEIEPFCREVLKKHWPGVPVFEDVTKLNGKEIMEAVGQIDCVAGGFP